MLHFVYEEIDPRIDTPKYVGITTNPNGRHGQHLEDSSSNPRKVAWIQELLNAGLQPKMRIIEVVNDRVTAQEREKYWIQTYESQGILLTNIKHNQVKKGKSQIIPIAIPPTLPKNDPYSYESLEYGWTVDKVTKDNTLNFREFACQLHILIACYCSIGGEPSIERKNSLHIWMTQKIEEYPQGDRQEKGRLWEEMACIIYDDNMPTAA